MSKRPETATEFDERFDAGEDMGQWVDWDHAYRPNRSERIEIDLPQAEAAKLGRVASREEVQRAELINRWLSEKLAAAA